MKMHQSKRPTLAEPLQGVTFEKADREEIQAQARALATLPHSARLAVYTALRHEVVRLDQAWDWTVPGSDNEAERRDLFQAAAVAYQAAEYAVGRD